MNKTRRRYVVELTKGQMKALLDCAICGMDVFSYEDENRKMIDKCKDATRSIYDAKANGLKTLK